MSQVSFLDNQLETYIHDMQSTEEFSAFKGIGQLVEKMIEMKKNVSYLCGPILPYVQTVCEEARPNIIPIHTNGARKGPAQYPV